MKRIYGFIVLLLSVLSFTACEDFMDLHKEFIEGGEIIYAPKPDSIAVYAGNERVEVKCWLYNAVNVRSVGVYWNSGADSLILKTDELGRTFNTGMDSVSITIPTKEEKTYTFNVRTTDNNGHKSLFSTALGSSYGQIYLSGLSDRRIQSINLDKDHTATITWFSKLESLVANEVRYITNDDESSIVRIPATQKVMILPNAKALQSFELRSLYIPEENAVDTFATAWKVADINIPGAKLAKEGMSIMQLDNDANWDNHEGAASRIIDDSYDVNWSYGHTLAGVPNWGSATRDLNSSLTIDLGREITLERLLFFNRNWKGLYKEANVKRFDVYVCDHKPSKEGNWEEWTKVSEYTINKPSGSPVGSETPTDTEVAKAGFPVIFSPTISTRYVRINVLETWGKTWYSHILELDFCGAEH